MILADKQIKELLVNHELLTPYELEKKVFEGVSYGLSSCSYDLRLDRFNGPSHPFNILPNQFALGCTLEHIRMPNNIVGLIKDKSTWARRGLSVFNTLIDPGFEGQITLELKNQGNDLLALPRGIGIAQIMFFECGEVENPYNGKYQGQQGVTGPIEETGK
ncbi:hypothetical protein LCGC14_0650170 [marine sediment metagenome]|uniref:Uncharacterized protein n=1 Tax=marine sediment metagenome TaxID=412755 RepID=A0A0F9U4V3_9ZZZZ|nr:dCTP deaminase [Candidatus Aminicenantes bacterium]